MNGRFDGPAKPMKKLIEDDFRGTLKVAKVVENYTKRNHAAGAPGAKFVGAATCKECHPKTFDFWAKTKHADAFTSLVNDPKPNSAFDAECVTCHTTGFEYNTGYLSPELTPYLRGNQCENCHGPGSKHASEPDNDSFRDLMTVTFEQADKNRLCIQCHDEDNSRDFEIKKYWKEIKHNALDAYEDPKVHRGIAPESLPPKTTAKVP
jgi:Cytochrome c554 and c-prime